MIIYKVATSAPKQTKKQNQQQQQQKTTNKKNIKEEKIKPFHKLCFQTSPVRYKGPISWFPPSQWDIVNQQTRTHRWHPGPSGCCSVHSINTEKQTPAQETCRFLPAPWHKNEGIHRCTSALHHCALMGQLPSVSEKCCWYSSYCTFTLLFTASLAGKLSHYIYI